MADNKSVLNLLRDDGSPLSLDNGATPPIPQFDQSTMHNEYSLNDNPNSGAVSPRNGALPSPTSLAVGDGLTRYMENLPSGA
jgi:hypothetical protein|tara:strand:+ start:2953 stop:3198 length:246 start_codon:yes stop_codon:yes gene_type:complete